MKFYVTTPYKFKWRSKTLLKYNNTELVLYKKQNMFAINLKYHINRLIYNLTPKRKLYPNGSVFHFTYGSPTRKDLFNKFICDRIFDRPKSYIKETPKMLNVQFGHAYHNFFDYSIGTEVDSKSRLYKDDLKKRGKVLMTEEDAESEASKNRKRIDKEDSDRSDESYQYEMNKYMKENNLNRGEVMRAFQRGQK